MTACKKLCCQLNMTSIRKYIELISFFCVIILMKCTKHETYVQRIDSKTYVTYHYFLNQTTHLYYKTSTALPHRSYKITPVIQLDSRCPQLVIQPMEKLYMVDQFTQFMYHTIFTDYQFQHYVFFIPNNLYTTVKKCVTINK